MPRRSSAQRSLGLGVLVVVALLGGCSSSRKLVDEGSTARIGQNDAVRLRTGLARQPDAI